MDAVTLVLVVKFTIAILLALGGILALYFGYRLYRNGVGINEDGSKIETKDMKVHLKTVGSVLMLTSFGWGWLSLSASPSLNKQGDNINVAVTAPTRDMRISVEPITTQIAATTVKDVPPEELKSLFRDAVKTIKVNGEPAQLISIEFRHLGDREIVSEWATVDQKKFSLTFEPAIGEGKMCFLQTETEIEGVVPNKNPQKVNSHQ